MKHTQQTAYDYMRDYLESEAGLPIYSQQDIAVPHLITEIAAEQAPGFRVESTAWFFPEAIETRAYYTQTGAKICRESEHRNGLFRLLNYLNARAFPAVTPDSPEHLYAPHLLFCPRFCMSEDECFDIMAITVIDYELFSVAPERAADYVAAFCPQLLDRLTMPVFNLLLGNISVDEAIGMVEDELGQ